MRSADESGQTAEEEGTVPNRLFWLLILGFVLVFAGLAIVLVAAVLYGNGSASFGGVVFIGPFPIVFGVGPESMWMVLFGVVLAVLSVIAFLVLRRRSNWSGD